MVRRGGHDRAGDGVYIEVGGDIVHVMTDPKDVPQTFFLYDADSGAYTQIFFD